MLAISRTTVVARPQHSQETYRILKIHQKQSTNAPNLDVRVTPDAFNPYSSRLRLSLTTFHEYSSFPSQPMKMSPAVSVVRADPRNFARAAGSGNAGISAELHMQLCFCNTHRENASMVAVSYDVMHRYAHTYLSGEKKNINLHGAITDFGGYSVPPSHVPWYNTVVPRSTLLNSSI